MSRLSLIGREKKEMEQNYLAISSFMLNFAENFVKVKRA